MSPADPPAADHTLGIGAPLSPAELAAFLGLGITARLACLDGDDWPYSVPVWFAWDGEVFWVIAAREAAWARHLLANPRVALCIDEPETLRRVMVQGTARLVEGPSADGRWVAIAAGMARRYLGPRAAGYAAATAGLERWLFAIEVRRLLGWRGAGRAEGRRHGP